jgi:hypothetical protein
MGRKYGTPLCKMELIPLTVPDHELDESTTTTTDQTTITRNNNNNNGGGMGGKQTGGKVNLGNNVVTRRGAGGEIANARLMVIQEGL